MMFEAYGFEISKECDPFNRDDWFANATEYFHASKCRINWCSCLFAFKGIIGPWADKL